MSSLIVTVLSIIGFIFFPQTSIQSVIIIIGFGFVALIGLISIPTSIINHIGDVSRISTANERLLAAGERAANLKRDIKETLGEQILNDELLVRANKDNPISGIVLELSRLNSNIEHERNRKHQAQENIYARKKGPFSFVVKLYGEE